MRTIKFRGKRVDNGEWLYGNIVELRNPFNPNDAPACFIMPKEVNIAAPDNIAEQEVVDPATVGQFTGAIDCDGREVYEHDILEHITLTEFRKATGNPWVGEGFDPQRFIVAYSNEDFGFCFHGRKRNHRWLNLQYYRVIGNIHDNPELLK